ncbi:hypothetical protein MD484_g8268, partial [Candolleomyces efflorescens]
MPNPFSHLKTRPGLILAPARTWERSVGLSMWLQAKQRAQELDSMVLWCDGGEGGFSGIAGGGYQSFEQVGSGSWVKDIGVDHPFREGKTLYARWEDLFVLAYWAAVLLPGIANMELTQRRFTGHKNLQPVHEDFDDFHIITDEDLLLPALPPTTIDFRPAPPDPAPVDHKGVPRLQVQTAEGIFVAPRHPPEPDSATTPLTADGDRTFASDTTGPSELGDIAKNFPPPPSFIPRSIAPRPARSLANPPIQAPVVIERAQSNTGTTCESIFSLSRFKTGVKRILRNTLRLPSFRKPSPRIPIFDPSAEAPASSTAGPQSPEFLEVQNTRRSVDNLSLAPLFHKYEFVDPSTLTASPPAQSTKDLIPGSTRSTFIPPSPSWIVSKATELEANSRQATGIARPEPPPPTPPAAPYVPSTPVIEQNEAFLFALESAPNILYTKYKQYGQLGVLGWCSEFGELIDHLKDLGFSGNMFVTTRVQALKACEDILKLNLDIKMQIIVMYLSYQVARLRRFLDGDRVWNDYPEPQFPLNYQGM